MSVKLTAPFLIILTLAAVRPAMAQSGTVSGTLTNALSGDTVANVQVTLQSGSAMQQTRSGPEGRFSFSNVAAGTYDLIVRADGFLPSRTSITVASVELTSNVPLSPELHFSEVTSVSPEAKDSFVSFQSTASLGGQELTRELQPTLGATLENQAGVALRSFGPGPARPVIRGMDGDRVLIAENGLRMGDLSSQSGDHGVNVNPASAQRIEVVRGPATLLYGANAIGGLVNVVTNEIPNAPATKATGLVTLDAATGAPGGGAAGNVTVGNGRFAVNLAAAGRRQNDFRSPEETIPNSFNRAGMAQVGAAYTGTMGFLGASYGYDKTHYGIPFVEAGETNLNPRRQNFTVRGEKRGMGGVFDSFRGSLGVRRYRHDELGGEEVVTSFRNDTSELELLAHHGAARKLHGAIGGSVLTREFEATGEEALSPLVDQKGFAAYLYEEVDASSRVQLQVGGRVDRATFKPAADEPNSDFTNFSGSFGVVLTPTQPVSLAFSVARASRNPALEELYFHGPHPGNNAIENGNPGLSSEHSLGIDASLRWRGTAGSGEVTFFANRINDFIFRRFTGEVDTEAGLAVTEFDQADARMVGMESHLDVRVGPVVWLEGGLDYVRGDLAELDLPMPRIPPLRGLAGLHLRKNAFEAGIDGTFTAKQDRVYALGFAGTTIGETPTDGYNLAKIFASYTFGTATAASTITLRLDNATNTLYRNHLNYLKDLAPEMGRNFAVVYSIRF
jgi:iron complex outermembrane receptor protein